MDIIDSGIFGRMFGAAEPSAELREAKPVRIQSIHENADMGCCKQPVGAFPMSTPVAMAYVPFQEWETPYEPEVALSRGTIFPSLDKPFLGEEAVRNVRKG